MSALLAVHKYCVDFVRIISGRNEGAVLGRQIETGIQWA
jgi:hypothetical protein